MYRFANIPKCLKPRWDGQCGPANCRGAVGWTYGGTAECLQIATANATGSTGMSTYGLHCNTCSGYQFTDVTISAGNAAPGASGATGGNGGNGTGGASGTAGLADGSSARGLEEEPEEMELVEAGGSGGAGAWDRQLARMGTDSTTCTGRWWRRWRWRRWLPRNWRRLAVKVVE